MHQNFEHTSYLIRRKVLKLFGGAFHVFGPSGELLFFSKMKAFKLKEDIRLYTDETMTTEVLTITARSVIDFSASYDVIDPQTGERVGVMRRKGWKSILKDEWLLLNEDEREIGRIREDSTMLALIRRFITNLIPQTFHGEVEGRVACVYKQQFNPFVMKLEVDFSYDDRKALDKRLGLAAGLLLCAIEGREG